jgi:preprotein translocase subunit SecE
LGRERLFEFAGVESIMAKSPFKFLQEVRAETDKVTWPTRRETMAASVLFLVADQIIRIGITFILGIAS